MWRGVEQPDYAGPRQPWTRPGFVAAAAFMVVVVLTGIGVALSAGGTPRAGGASASGDPSAGAASSAEPDSQAPADLPTAPPDDVSWQLFGQVATPVSTTDGPRRITDTTASGYTHRPAGALIAASQLMTRAGFSNGRRVWEPTILEQFVPSADRDRLLATMRALPEEPAKPGELAQFTGFRFQSYRADAAVLDLSLQAPADTSSPQVVTVTVWWRDGDWRMVAPPGGSWLSLAHPATDLTGFVAWRAE